ncbi:hypothetical protein [Carnobacterium divergens]|uniref:hypothetical protein n=1 Tax=Carnobacterium divergens TaxID=2748 RepID=UPI0010744CF9|nr:hypothetical protein [Carnobacterium divergens]TFI86615.1 hypothetical protein CKN61_13195 [Carnobacterium divergens]
MSLENFTDGDLLYATKLNKNFKEVEQQTTVQSTIAGAKNGATNSLELTKIGKIVYVTGEAKVPNANGSSTTVECWAIPDGFKPKKDTNFQTAVGAWEDTAKSLFRATTGGNIVAIVNKNSSDTHYFNSFWIIN